MTLTLIKSDRIQWRGYTLDRTQAEAILRDYRKEANVLFDMGEFDGFDEVAALVVSLKAAASA